MKYVQLGSEEENRVKNFLLSAHQIPLSFWENKKLLKRVHSVWVLSKEASQALDFVRCDSAGLMLFLESKSLKLSKQGEAFLQNKRGQNSIRKNYLGF